MLSCDSSSTAYDTRTFTIEVYHVQIMFYTGKHSEDFDLRMKIKEIIPFLR